jgi:hypothetical protein
MTPSPGKEKPLARLNRWLYVVLTPLRIVGNFVFLSIAWFIGVGISSLLYRMGPGRRNARENRGAHETPDALDATGSWWRKLPPAPAAREAWRRPF